MDWKPEAVSALSRYFFDYVVGVLWMLAVVSWASPTTWISSLLQEFGNLSSAPATTRIPDFVFGFLLAIGGIVLPYCVSVVFKPATLRLMSWLQVKESEFLRRRLNSKEVIKDAEAISLRGL